MHEVFISLCNENINKVIKELLSSSQEKKDSLLCSFASIIGLLPENIFIYLEFCRKIRAHEDILKFFVDEVEKQINRTIEDKKSEIFCFYVQFLYLCEYCNIIDSDVDKVMNQFNENTKNVVFGCRKIEENKLMIKKEQETVKIQLNIKCDVEFCQITNDYITNFIKLAKSVCKNLDCSLGDAFVAVYLVKSFGFDKSECISQLNRYFDYRNYCELIVGLLMANMSNAVGSIFLKFVIVALGENKGFFSTFYDMVPKIDRNTFINSTLALIYVTYYVQPPKMDAAGSNCYKPYFEDSEVNNFKLLIDESSAIEIIKVANKTNLNNFLPEQFLHLLPEDKQFEPTELKQLIDANEMDKIKEMDRRVFFEQFCIIAYPSISHCLVYLEILAAYFSLEKADQRLFLSIFYKINENRFSYLEHIGKKLVFFRIIDDDVASEYPYIFY